MLKTKKETEMVAYMDEQGRWDLVDEDDYDFPIMEKRTITPKMAKDILAQA